MTTQWFKEDGDAVASGRPSGPEDALQGLGGSAFLQVAHEAKTGQPPRCNLETERTLGTTLLGLIQSDLVKSAHDCSEGGLAVALLNAPSPIWKPATRRVFSGRKSTCPLWKMSGWMRCSLARATGALSSPPPIWTKLWRRQTTRVRPTYRYRGRQTAQAQDPAGEHAWEVAGLHDLWWNSIGNAMA